MLHPCYERQDISRATLASPPTESEKQSPLKVYLLNEPRGKNQVHNFHPMNTIKWTDARGTALTTSVQYPSVTQTNMYVGISSIEVEKSDWDSWKSFKCAVDHQNTEKSVQVEKKPSPPKVSLLNEPRGNNQVLFCRVEDFLPNEITVKWKKNGIEIDGIIWDPKKNGETYSTVRLLQVSNTDWNSEAVYSCEVSHRQKTYIRKASKAVITVSLKQPNPKEIFSNKQAKLECVITGRDRATVQNTQITWEIDGPNQTNSTTEELKTEGDVSKKTSTLTQSLTDWLTVKKVRCSAEGEYMSPVTREIIVQKGGGTTPKVTIHILPDDVIKDVNEVTLICLVSTTIKQDYYIAWSEYVRQGNGVYSDGITLLPEKTENGYMVASLYTTTKTKWEKSMFECNVWPAGSNNKFKSPQVSKAIGNAIECR